jgi:hypothetical protein
MEITVYGGSLVSQNAILTAVAKIKAVFQGVTREWIEVFTELLMEEKFTDEELKQSVIAVFKETTFTGAPPAPAKFLNYKNRPKLFTPTEIEIMVHQGKAFFKEFGIVEKTAAGVFMARRSEMQKYGIPEIKPTVLT